MNPKLPGKVTVPRGYALVVGIGQYKNLPEKSALHFTESDANAIYRVLISSEFGGFRPEDVHTLIGPQATLANIRKELEQWLPSVAGANDRVVVYFAGHGLVSNGRGFLAPYDISLTDLENTSYPMARMAQVMAKNIKSTQKVLFTDACHSGKITPESTDEAIAEQWKKQENPYFLTFTATSEREQSFEDPNLSTGFGLFTYFLVQGLQGQADTQPCDGFVTADELVAYVTQHVHDYAFKLGRYQSPKSYGDYDPGLILSVSRGCPDNASSLVSSTGVIVVESNMDDVQLYVDDKLIGLVSKTKPLSLPGLAAGVHTFKGVRKGYQPDTKQKVVIPGQPGSVQIRIQYPVEVKRSALDLVEQGEKILFTHRSSFDPLYMARKSQSGNDVKKAFDLFEKALKEDPNYAKAAYDAGLAAQLLSDDKATLESFKRAVDLDASFMDARLEYAGALIESGDPDEAIRDTVEATRLDPKNDQAYSYMARAYLDKEVYDRAIESANRAIELRARNEQAFLWRAEAQRRLAESIRKARKDDARKLLEQARDDFKSYINMTTFSNPAYEKLAFYFIGFGLGARSHSDRQQSYSYQRSVAFLGLCASENQLGNSMKAAEYCRTALKYDAKDPVAYFLLGNAYRDLYNSHTCVENLEAARDSYSQSLSLNADLDFSKLARGYVEQINSLLNSPKLRSRMTCSAPTA